MTPAERAAIEARDAELVLYDNMYTAQGQTALDRRALLAELKEREAACVWMRDSGIWWQTGCGRSTSVPLSPFCLYCGHPIKEAT